MTLSVKRIVLTQELAQHPTWHAVSLYGTTQHDRVQALCAVAQRLGIEVVLHGEWTCAPSAEALTPVRLSFDARPARPEDLWVGTASVDNLSIEDVELILLRRLVEKLDLEAALRARDDEAKGRRILRKEYHGFEAASDIDRDVSEMLLDAGIEGEFGGTIVMEARYVEPPAPQVDLPPPPSAKRSG